MEQALNFTEEEFTAFALIFMANADNNIGEKEKKHIQSKVNVETFDKMFSLFQETSDYNRIQQIVAHKNAYLSDEVKLNSFIENLQSLIAADNKTDVMEKFSLNNLIRVLK
jgi:uncharacterized membrane protein YebE (DUF533 family)